MLVKFLLSTIFLLTGIQSYDCSNDWLDYPGVLENVNYTNFSNYGFGDFGIIQSIGDYNLSSPNVHNLCTCYDTFPASFTSYEQLINVMDIVKNHSKFFNKNNMLLNNDQISSCSSNNLFLYMFDLLSVNNHTFWGHYAHSNNELPNELLNYFNTCLYPWTFSDIPHDLIHYAINQYNCILPIQQDDVYILNGIICSKNTDVNQPNQQTESTEINTYEFETNEPTSSPTNEPTSSPTFEPTSSPTFEPTSSPTFEPTSSPTYEPTSSSTNEPTSSPTFEPTSSPTFEPTSSPTFEPTSSPTFEPTNEPNLFINVQINEQTNEQTKEQTYKQTRKPKASRTPKPIPTQIPTETIKPIPKPIPKPTQKPKPKPISIPKRTLKPKK